MSVYRDYHSTVTAVLVVPEIGGGHGFHSTPRPGRHGRARRTGSIDGTRSLGETDVRRQHSGIASIHPARRSEGYADLDLREEFHGIPERARRTCARDL